MQRTIIFKNKIILKEYGTSKDYRKIRCSLCGLSSPDKYYIKRHMEQSSDRLPVGLVYHEPTNIDPMGEPRPIYHVIGNENIWNHQHDAIYHTITFSGIPPNIQKNGIIGNIRRKDLEKMLHRGLNNKGKKSRLLDEEEFERFKEGALALKLKPFDWRGVRSFTRTFPDFEKYDPEYIKQQLASQK